MTVDIKGFQQDIESIVENLTAVKGEKYTKAALIILNVWQYGKVMALPSEGAAAMLFSIIGNDVESLVCDKPNKEFFNDVKLLIDKVEKVDEELNKS